jgi:hypothetical protein
MVQVIRALAAILFRPCKAIVATPTDPAREPHANELSDFDVFSSYSRPQCDDSAHAFVPADVRELDV